MKRAAAGAEAAAGEAEAEEINQEDTQRSRLHCTSAPAARRARQTSNGTARTQGCFVGSLTCVFFGGMRRPMRSVVSIGEEAEAATAAAVAETAMVVVAAAIGCANHQLIMTKPKITRSRKMTKPITGVIIVGVGLLGRVVTSPVSMSRKTALVPAALAAIATMMNSLLAAGLLAVLNLSRSTPTYLSLVFAGPLFLHRV